MSVPICVKCKKEMRCVKNGAWWIKTRPVENAPIVAGGVGVSVTAREPYRATMGDRYRCDGCGAEVIAGLALQSKESHEDGFHDLLRGAVKCGDELVYES